MIEANSTIHPAPRCEQILALCERLRRHASRRYPYNLLADLRLCNRYLRQLASLLIAEEALKESNPRVRRLLQNESIQLWTEYEGGDHA